MASLLALLAQVGGAAAQSGWQVVQQFDCKLALAYNQASG